MHFWNQVKEVSFSHRIIWNLSAYWYQLVDVCVLKHAWAVLTLTIPAKMPHLWVKIHLMGKVFLCPFPMFDHMTWMCFVMYTIHFRCTFHISSFQALWVVPSHGIATEFLHLQPEEIDEGGFSLFEAWEPTHAAIPCGCPTQSWK